MADQNVNSCIKCSVKQCKNHCQEENYCALDQIKVGTHEPNPSEPKCTDCESFEVK